MGLPLACAFAEAGHVVIGIDVSLEKVEGVNAGRSHITDVPPSQVKRLVNEKRLRATNEFAAARTADVAIISVPTPIDEYRVPDLSYVKSAAMSLAEVMPKGASSSWKAQPTLEPLEKLWWPPSDSRATCQLKTCS